MSKKERGQFYTTNAKYILQGLEKGLNKPKHIFDPFCGQGDLLQWGNKKFPTAQHLVGYDIDPALHPTIVCNAYNFAWTTDCLITNPPWLARNKTKSLDNLAIMDMLKTDDLYKAAILKITNQPQQVSQGILVVPQNFFFSYDANLRRKFFQYYHIVRCNMFYEPVFDDTNYATCAFSFKAGQNNSFSCYEFPEGKYTSRELVPQFGYQIKSLFWEYALREGEQYFSRTINISKTSTNIIAYLVDGGTERSRIRLECGSTPRQGIPTDRAIVGLDCTKYLSSKKQEQLVLKFQTLFDQLRQQGDIDFLLPTYRESKNGKARKRLPLEYLYNILNNLLIKE